MVFILSEMSICLPYNFRLCFMRSDMAVQFFSRFLGFRTLYVWIKGPFSWSSLCFRGIFEARLSYLFILILCLKELWQSRMPVVLKGTKLLCFDHHKVITTDRFYIFLEALQVAWMSLMSLLLQPHNVPIVAMLSLIENLTSMSVVPVVRLKPKYLLLYCLAMGQATFFFQVIHKVSVLNRYNNCFAFIYSCLCFCESPFNQSSTFYWRF